MDIHSIMYFLVGSGPLRLLSSPPATPGIYILKEGGCFMAIRMAIIGCGRYAAHRTFLPLPGQPDVMMSKDLYGRAERAGRMVRSLLAFAGLSPASCNPKTEW